jgi:hypothetical protein
MSDGLARESIAEALVGNLDGDITAEACIARAIDLPMPPDPISEISS